MKRNTFVASASITSAFATVIALGLLSTGCSSTSNGGTGGAGGSTGLGGAAGGGAGGKTGTGGTTGGTGGKTGGTGGAAGAGAGGAAGAKMDAGSDALMTCGNSAPNEGATCNNNPACAKSCGVNISVLTSEPVTKNCMCSSTWTCGTCNYPTDVNLDCLRLPSPVPACPHITVDGGDAGSGLIKTNSTPCEVPNSEVCGNVCGSATAGTFSYQDGAGASQVGYCACILGVYQCASVADWPKF